MALPNITLAQFNAISNGQYNAGQIDFGTGRNGETELVKVNNHVRKREMNNDLSDENEAKLTGTHFSQVLEVPEEQKQSAPQEDDEDLAMPRIDQ